MADLFNAATEGKIGQIRFADRTEVQATQPSLERSYAALGVRAARPARERHPATATDSRNISSCLY